MKKIFYSLALLLLSVTAFGTVNNYSPKVTVPPPPTYPTFGQSLSATNILATGTGGFVTGTVNIVNNVLTVNFGGGWTTGQQLRTASPVFNFGISPSLPNMELGAILFSSTVPSSTGYFIKIQNNSFVIYTNGPPMALTSCSFNVTIDLDCVTSQGAILNPDTTWYLDDDLDGFGDPATSIVQCYKPDGNYVLDNSDLCPTIYGSLANCGDIVANSSSNLNYVKTKTYKVSTSSPISSPPIQDVNQAIVYYDGLGRPIQQIAYAQSNAGKDIITPIEYDKFGRQLKEYLPLASTQDNLAYVDGTSLQSDIIAQYQAQFGDSNPYSEKLFEASPLNRILKQAAPGNDWAMGQGHEIRLDYDTNIEGEVRLFKATTSPQGGLNAYEISFDGDGYYAHHQLYKTVTKNENWTGGLDNTVEEFRDKEGHLLLKRTYEKGEPLDTYYVYDIYGNLTYVLPPLVDLNTIDQNVLDNLCYQYKYDLRNRLVEKKLPGKQWEYIAYNSQDMPVAAGPAFFPFGGGTTGWLITKYDAFGRTVYTGWQDYEVTQKNRVTIETTVSGSNWRENFTTNASTIDNFPVNYTNNVEPKIIKLLTINFYDSYNFYGLSTPPVTEVANQPVLLGNLKGLPTASWVRVLDSPIQIVGNWNSILYDEKARPIRNHNTNYLGGFTCVDTNLNFTGMANYTVTTHKRTNQSALLTILDNYYYTPQDRLSKHTQKINSLATETLVENSYDIWGQLNAKDVGGTGTPFQKVSFKNNIRGWLTQINDISNLQQGSDPKDLFAFKIEYNYPDVSGGNSVPALYNGNISQTNWITSTDNNLRRYSYFYDNLSRLKNATYQKPGGIMFTTNMYDETLEYDKNGNIQLLKRNGDLDDDFLGAGPLEIDNLTYIYDEYNKNQLLRVTDSTNDPKGFKDDTLQNDTNNVSDYAYDGNGNLERDDNKDIRKIVYNHLNLPTRINIGDGNKIRYFYDAEGRKHRKEVEETGTTTITDYLDGFQYSNTILNYFPQAEGYVSVTLCETCQAQHQTQFNYVYQYKDHLGNIRVNYGYDEKDKKIKIIEEEHYYPFGLKHTNYNSGQNKYAIGEIGEEIAEKTILRPIQPGELTNLNKYKYNSKEWQDELSLNVFDYGARNYDPALGRWMNIDNLAEKYVDKSPYSYVLNNPVNMLDPDGNFVISAAFANRYPQITKYLRENMKSDVMNSKPIMDALFNNTRRNGNPNNPGNLDANAVDFALTDGTGPRLDYNIQDPLNTGYYDDGRNIIYLDQSRLDGIEKTLKASDKDCTSEDKLKALLGIYMLILHELAHYGDLLDQEMNDTGEKGRLVEAEIWFIDKDGKQITTNTDKFDPNTQEQIINLTKGVTPTLPTNNKGNGKKIIIPQKRNPEFPGSAGPAPSGTKNRKKIIK